ncbi:MAG: magnesium transporter [Candidatus Omnitrophica bacterium]|nr:magnesium transporter [Candidatus Omnitrophota bacterium]
MRCITNTEQWKALAETDINQAATEFGAITAEQAAAIARQAGAAYIINIVLRLDTDAAAGMLRNLPDDFREQVLAGLPQEKAREIREVMSYAPGTAGALMAKEVLAISVDRTIQEATAYLRLVGIGRKGKVSYIYAVDNNRRIEGVIQIRDLIFYPPQKSIREIVRKPVVQVEAGMSQLDVARLLQKHRYLGLPVVDREQRLVGVISADNALQVLDNEASDDIARIVGTSPAEIKTHSTRKIFNLRLPWLFISIASGLFCAVIMHTFQHKIADIAVLFLFVPVVLGLSESIGVQGATIVVRNMSLGFMASEELRPLFLRELAVGIWIGLTCGLVVGLVAWLWQGACTIGIALAIAMICAMFISSLIGLSLPVVFKKLKVDPAMASGPIVLAICDIQTLLGYFTIAGLVLKIR